MWYSSVQETQNRNTKKSQKMWQCFLYILVQNEVVFPFVQKRSQRHPHFWQNTHSPVFRCSAWLRSLFQMYTCNDATIATFLGCIFYSGKNLAIFIILYIKLQKYARFVRNTFCRFLSMPDWPIFGHVTITHSDLGHISNLVLIQTETLLCGKQRNTKITHIHIFWPT